MKYYTLEPEVAGGFGPKSILDDPSARPPRIKHFNYEFAGWAGDPLLTTVASFIVTAEVKAKIEESEAKGVQFGIVEISKSGEFEDFFPGRELPKFVWLQVTGKAGVDDFDMSPTHRLIVSQRILDILRSAGMSHCEICEFNP
jgi:hypothetical protein